MSETSLETRVAILEVDSEYVHEVLDDNTSDHREIKTDVKSVLSRLDKQNGTLPDLKFNVQSIQKDMKGIQKDMGSVKEKIVGLDMKSKITWAVISSLVTGIIALAIKFFG